MPSECEKYRLQLIIEYNRVLAWGKAAGLIDIPEGSTLGETLGTNATELITIVARIQWLLAEFRDLNARYGNELNPDAGNNMEEIVKGNTTAAVSEKSSGGSDVDVVKQVSGLAVSYEAEAKERRHRRGTNHIQRFFRNAKEVVSNPRRVRWVVIDQEAFEALLQDLHALTERLHELMREHRDRRIDDITARTYREMILARDGIQDLRDMFDAVSSLVVTSSATRKEKDAHANDKTLQDLVRLKKIARTSESILARLKTSDKDKTKGSIAKDDIEQTFFDADIITVKRYTNADLSEDFGWNDDDPLSLTRPRGIMSTSGEEGDIPVWVEWKTIGDYAPGSLKDKESSLRTLALAQMLHIPKPVTLHAPECIGFFDDRDVHGTDRYGWIFKMSDGADYDTQVLSLYDILGEAQFKPSLRQRVSLAHKLCTTVLDLHAVNWLHKGIFSDNVVFQFNTVKENSDEGHQEEGGDDRQELTYNPESPFLTGFEFSRPEGTETTSRDTDIVWDLYRWPGIQRQRPTERNSRKAYDLYSLGLVMLEIAHWKPLHQIMHLGEKQQTKKETEEETERNINKDPPNVSLEESKMVRDWLLGIKSKNSEEAPFEKAGEPNPVRELRNIIGDRYCDVVTRCLWAYGEKGFGVTEEQTTSSLNDKSGFGARLQESFTSLVVEELGLIAL